MSTIREENKAFIQLSRLAIAQLTTGKKRLNKEAYTSEQLKNAQRFANNLQRNKNKDFMIIY